MPVLRVYLTEEQEAQIRDAARAENRPVSNFLLNCALAHISRYAKRIYVYHEKTRQRAVAFKSKGIVESNATGEKQGK